MFLSEKNLKIMAVFLNCILSSFLRALFKITHQVLVPCAVARWRQSQLNDACDQKTQQQHRCDKLPHIVIVAVWGETKHVLQILKEPE